MKTLSLLFFLCGLSRGVVDKYTGCLDGVQTAISYLTFNERDPDYYTNACTNKLVVTSMWAAGKVYCTPREIAAGEKQFAGYCEEYSNVKLIPYAEVLPILTDDYIKSLPIAQFSDIEDFTVFNTSVMISRSLYKAGRDTYVTFDLEYVLHQRYGWAMYGFWGGLLLIGILNRLSKHFYQSRHLKTLDDVEGRKGPSSHEGPRSGVIASVNSIHHWLRSNVIVPAAFGTHHNRPLFWTTIPTRMETIVVISFWLMTFILCCVGYHIFWPNLYYTEPQQAWRYISDRAGILCYAMLPWLWMFSGRNNIFLWLTGWSFATFNIFHRHIARCATVLAIVHSVGWSVLEGGFDYYSESWKEQYWYMGGMATVAMSLIVLFSFMWFRVKSYEVFLLIHIALSVVTIVGLFYHTAIFNGEYNGYLWPLVAIWSFDRAARLARWAYCNLHIRWSHAVVSSTASATYDKDGDFIRLEIVPGSRMLRPGPGQHYFLYQPLKWKGWENHPFTLGAYETVRESEPASVATVDTGAEPRTYMEALEGKDTEVVAASSSSPPSMDVTPDPSQHKLALFQDKVGRQKLSFLIRPFGSWTRRLRDQCLKSPTGVITPRLFIEGPYGEHSPLHTYENVVFIVGGTGISGAMPYLQDHVKRTSDNGQTPRPGRKVATCTRDITLVWSTKQSAMIRSVVAHELKPMLGREDIHIHLHVTTSKEPQSSSLDAPKDEDHHAVACDNKDVVLKGSSATNISDDGLTISHGRPDISATIMSIINDVHNAGKAGGRIAILTCGPGGMADEARAAVHAALKQGKRGVEYFEEAFG
ncbi:uncharacterized protein Z520_12077 [Fonsecaea multimorphosa CBS 102226]|uniref:FAD-binding FR-type domain-containing protein n=1 Tax=Fonsecaea multimorphosa CBS 102226 TaxID=1442371 RepID=A0A0D2I4J2_9EURO|nr:uncharacterized protein Z520_12077 [Fonsecaea multimorphosa CBS 102226]KIX92196.1 hypothetical protein Z520_12077 [Fonsecaea multimorphosa CBS 102226]